MKSLICFILGYILLGNITFAQSYNPVTGKQDFRDSIKFTKYTNNSAGDSVFTIDPITKKLKFIERGATVTYVDSSINIVNNTIGVDRTTILLTGNLYKDTLMDFGNTNLTYLIQGNYYTANASEFTFNPADDFLDRYTIVYADTLGNIHVEDCAEGIPTVLCGVSQYDLLLGVYFIPATSTTPQNVTSAYIYRENIVPPEAVVASVGVAAQAQYTGLAPYAGLYSVYVSSISGSAAQRLTFTLPDTLDKFNFSLLNFQLNLVSTLPQNTRLNFNFYLGNSLVTTNSVALVNNSFGYKRNDTAWQPISVPMDNFNFFSPRFNRISISMSGPPASGFQIDNMSLQGGGVINPPVSSQNIDTTKWFDGSYLSADKDSVYFTNHGNAVKALYLEPTLFKDSTGIGSVKTGNTLAVYTTGAGLADSMYFFRYVLYDSVMVFKNANGDSATVVIRGSGSSGSSGISKLGNGTGLTEPNDSTYNVDFSVVASVQSVIDSAAAIQTRLDLKKDKADSVLPTGYATQYDLTKTKDSLQTNISLKKNIADSVSGVATDYVTQYQRKKTSDSLAALIALKQNLVTLTTTGTSGAATFNQSTGALNVPQYSGGSGGISYTRQVHSSGATVTVTGGNYILTIDPASTLAAVAVTMPASPNDLEIVEIGFGGTLPAGTVVTSLTILPNSGQTIQDNTPPGNGMADNTLYYRYYTAKTVWQRIKL